MSTERYFLIRCNSCGRTCDPVDSTDMRETELRKDLVKRLAWVSYRTDSGDRVDICPLCKKGGN